MKLDIIKSKARAKVTILKIEKFILFNNTIFELLNNIIFISFFWLIKSSEVYKCWYYEL